MLSSASSRVMRRTGPRVSCPGPSPAAEWPGVPALSTATSSAVSARRASPSHLTAQTASASSSTTSASLPCPRSGSAIARRSTPIMSDSSSGSSRKSVDRETSALFTAKSGFSVVAPISVIAPRSTSPSSTSCWLLLKRWISSRNSTVRVPSSPRRRLASSRIARIWATPTDAAFSLAKCRRRCRAITSARVVLPVPGGPKSRMLVSRSAWSMRRSSLPGPRMCCCPAISSSVRGRMRTASGSTPRSACSRRACQRSDIPGR